MAVLPEAVPTADVWVLQRKVAHYRIPVWDTLCDLSGGRFRLEVLGTLDNGKPFGGGPAPDYLHDLAGDNVAACVAWLGPL